MAEAIPKLTPELVRHLHEEGAAELAFFAQHHDEFLEKYKEQFVVVHNGQVIGHSPELDGACHLVDEKGLDIRDVWLHYVPDPDEQLVV